MDFAQEVKAAADIVTVVGAHVQLKRQGGNRYLGLCPFHSEKTPSFSVHAVLQIYKCFGCGKSGDVFSFLMEIQGLTFIEALKLLADQQGKPMPAKGRGPESDAAARKRSALHEIHEIAQEFFTAQLRARGGAGALRYFRDRGLGRAEIEEFGLGYAPDRNALLAHLKGRGFKRGDVLESGLVGASEKGDSVYDRFRDRLMFPIHSDAGKLIAYGGRQRQGDRGPKYLNSPETPIYRKNAVLFNMHRARMAMRQRDLAVLVEGYMDVIGVWKAGIRNAVATCGTALTPQQISLIRRHCDTVVVNFDSDAAGQAAAGAVGGNAASGGPERPRSGAAGRHGPGRVLQCARRRRLPCRARARAAVLPLAPGPVPHPVRPWHIGRPDRGVRSPAPVRDAPAGRDPARSPLSPSWPITLACSRASP